MANNYENESQRIVGIIDGIVQETKLRLPQDAERVFSREEVLGITRFAARTGLAVGENGSDVSLGARLANHESAFQVEEPPMKLLVGSSPFAHLAEKKTPTQLVGSSAIRTYLEGIAAEARKHAPSSDLEDYAAETAVAIEKDNLRASQHMTNQLLAKLEKMSGKS